MGENTCGQDEMERRVQGSLENTPHACSSLAKLSGGVANYVYRGNLRTILPDGSETVVVKHTEAFSASNNNFKISDTRCVSCTKWVSIAWIDTHDRTTNRQCSKL